VPDPATSVPKQALLSSARRIYSRYLDAVAQVSGSGGEDVTILRPLLTDDALKDEVASFADLRARGIHTEGEVRLVEFQPQKVSAASGRVVAYACVDLAEVRVRDESGKDVTPRSRPNRQTSLATFVTSGGVLRLDENGSWSGESIC
jgi:hypothetical protein